MATVFSYQEAFEKSLEYFKGDELAAKVFIDKYALRNNNQELLEQSPTDMHWRLAKEFARIEKTKFKAPYTEEEIFSYFDKFKYLVPQGSPMNGIGNNHQIVSLSNCFVVESPTDSYGGIMKTDQQLVQISKRRGGNGTDLSNLRPSGTLTSNAARTSTGIVSWMRRYSNSIREVCQDGRRGALMLTLSVHHPDIEQFITIKNDDKEVTGANISVRLTDDFLNALKNDEEYEQCFPVDYKEKGITPLISKKVRASHIWKLIINSAWLRAEPGILFWDRITNYNAVDCYADEGFKTVSTNPCLPLSTHLLTKEGIKQLRDIKIGDKIWSSEGWTNVINKFKTGIKDTYKYSTTHGSITCTENHELVFKGKKVQAKDAEGIDILRGVSYEKEIILDPQDIMDGLVIGDGTYHKASKNKLLCIGEKDKDYFQSEISHLIHEDAYTIQDCAWHITTTITDLEIPLTFKRIIPDRFIYGSRSKKCGFLRGLYSANGSIAGGRITLKAASFEVIQTVQLMLNSLGIASYYTVNKQKNVTFTNGTYLCKQSYDLNITRDKWLFAQMVGFIQLDKQERMNNLSKVLCDKPEVINKEIISKQFVATEEVWDITVDNDSHTFWCEGFNISNCSEIGLCEFDSCRLLLINLFSFITNPFTKEASFDFEKFIEYTKVAQRLMDDLVDLELEKIEAIINKIKDDPESDTVKAEELYVWTKVKDKCLKGRRTGLGITAEGDALAALNIPYSSEEAIKHVGDIHKAMKLASFQSSMEMAKEIGAFPIWNWEKEKNSAFLLKIKEENIELYNNISKYGRRNIANLTIAPAGSVSILTQTSSGIEPVYTIKPYTRRKKINPSDKHGKVDFIDQNGDCWQEFEVYHPKLKLWMEVTGETDWKKSPWFGNCAEDIDWIKRVKLQAVAQQNIDHAISSTLNLPNDVEESKISEIYTAAWEHGLKGVTVYRDGCRTGVLVQNKTEEIKPSNVIKRPKELSCDVYHSRIKGEQFYVVVGLMHNKPYEVFTGRNLNDVIPSDIKEGKTVKKARGQYFLVVNELEVQLNDIAKHEDIDALTRILSTALRHGSDVSFIVHQLEKTKGDMQSFAKVVARNLKKYIKDGTLVKGEECPSCEESGTLVRESGCVKCKECGWTKCS